MVCLCKYIQKNIRARYLMSSSWKENAKHLNGNFKDTESYSFKDSKPTSINDESRKNYLLESQTEPQKWLLKKHNKAAFCIKGSCNLE